VDSHAHVERCDDEEDIARIKLDANMQTLIVEAVDHLPDHPTMGSPVKMSACAMPHNGVVLASWLKMSMPSVMWRWHGGIKDSMVIVHSIVLTSRASAHARTR